MELRSWERLAAGTGIVLWVLVTSILLVLRARGTARSVPAPA